MINSTLHAYVMVHSIITKLLLENTYTKDAVYFHVVQSTLVPSPWILLGLEEEQPEGETFESKEGTAWKQPGIKQKHLGLRQKAVEHGEMLGNEEETAQE